MQTEWVRLEAADRRQGRMAVVAVDPGPDEVMHGVRARVVHVGVLAALVRIFPPVVPVTGAGARRVLPLRFAGQPIVLPADFRQPFEIGAGIQPAHAGHRMLGGGLLPQPQIGPMRFGVVLPLVVDVAAATYRHLVAGRVHELAVLPVGDFVLAQCERPGNGHFVRRAHRALAHGFLASHDKAAARDHDHVRALLAILECFGLRILGGRGRRRESEADQHGHCCRISIHAAHSSPQREPPLFARRFHLP